MRVQWAGRAAVLVFALLATTACATTYAQGRSYPNHPSRGGVYRGGYVNPASQRGFDDGYRRGFDAARDGNRFNPRRERWYRDAERGYNRRYGSRSDYRQVYRDAFTRGYEQGYREARYRDNGRYRPW
jgi:hypothetical protein